MELLKNLFSEGEALTYDQLTEKISAAGLKLANIADGSYVSRDKMDSAVQADLANLRQQREDDGKAWQQKIDAQAYEFAVREKANEVKFTSTAAKKQFIADAIAKQFKRGDDGKMQGYDEFLTQYKADDPGSFVVDEPAPAKKGPSITVPAKPDGGTHKMSLSEQMAAANADPNFVPDFD